jgi:hypothetical protein
MCAGAAPPLYTCVAACCRCAGGHTVRGRRVLPVNTVPVSDPAHVVPGAHVVPAAHVVPGAHVVPAAHVVPGAHVVPAAHVVHGAHGAPWERLQQAACFMVVLAACCVANAWLIDCSNLSVWCWGQWGRG